MVGIACALVYLHRRHVKKQRAEDAADRHASLDFGLGEVHRPKRGEKANGLTITADDYDEEKHKRQMSMDMVSPYLLPPELHTSRESLHSLSRAGQDSQDPYRPVTQYLEETGSIRSFRPHGDAASIMTASSGPSRLRDNATAGLLVNAQRMSRTDPPTGYFPPRQNSLAPSGLSTPRDRSPVESPATPILQVPAPVAAPIARKGLSVHPETSRVDENHAPNPGFPQDEPRESYMGQEDAVIRNSNNYLGNFLNSAESSAPPTPPSKSPEPIEMPAMPEQRHSMDMHTQPTLPPLIIPQPVAQHAIIENFDAASQYGDDFKVTPPSPGQNDYAAQRYSMDVPPEEYVQAGLGAPGFDANRLSMTFRPLPPDSLTADVEDPETRANRIRSFYKEYFDENKPVPAGQYYEDYDENYLGDAAYYDPDTNNFVMPYAQPVTRRAMTPPPNAQRRPFMGQEGRSRPRNGSMGGSPMGRPRFLPPVGGPRPYSSASNRGPNRMRVGGQRRPMPPPQPLTSLPTPSKLRDDTFALMGATDFAPPVSYRDRGYGRSESPLGERRLYSPSVPAHRPLVTAYDELAPIPSP